MGKQANNTSKWLLLGCIVPLIVLILLFIGITLWLSYPTGEPSPPPEFISKAQPDVSKRQKEIEEKKEQLKEKKLTYDIDQTIMALFSIERALSESKDFESLTPFILQDESDMISPEILALKYEFFNIYKDMLSSKDELDEQDSIYKVTTNSLLDLVSSFNYMTLQLDQKQIKKVWEKRLKASNLREEIKNRLSEHQNRLLDFYFEYLKLSSKYMKEWNRLCSSRDRAYLAVYEGDLDEVIKNALVATDLAPYEKEAHILLAMALLERNKETDTLTAHKIIDGFLKKHQGQEAPALLLRGVIKFQNGDYDAANIDFDQAATYFPKQQEALLNKLNLYKKRNFLNKSKEGRMIVNLYRRIMSGSGYFSPDFQKARVYLKQGEQIKAKKKIFDHFFRRRLQGQWDSVLSDFQQCNRYLGAEMSEISNGSKLTLEIDSAFLTNSVIVTIHNNSNKDIHNMTILLCVRFTDMFMGDYISFPVGETVALLKSGASITIGRKNISDLTIEKLGSKKEFKDIIEYAAVLISDEVITWVEPKKANVEKVPNTKNEDEFISKETTKKAKKVVKGLIKDTLDVIIKKQHEADKK